MESFLTLESPIQQQIDRANDSDESPTNYKNKRGNNKNNDELVPGMKRICQRIAFEYFDPRGTGLVPQRALDAMNAEIKRNIRRFKTLEARERERYALTYGKEKLLDAEREEQEAEQGAIDIHSESDSNDNNEEDEYEGDEGDEDDFLIASSDSDASIYSEEEDNLKPLPQLEFFAPSTPRKQRKNKKDKNERKETPHEKKIQRNEEEEEEEEDQESNRDTQKRQRKNKRIKKKIQSEEEEEEQEVD